MSLVLGVLAVLTGITIVGGVVLGGAAVTLGLLGRARARELGHSGALPVAGIVLGAVGLLVALGAYLYVRDEVSSYQDCRKESVSRAMDERCRADLERDLGVRS